MTLEELNDGQRLQLKQELIRRRLEEKGEGISYVELADADTLVSDEELETEFGDTEFAPDDFASITSSK